MATDNTLTLGDLSTEARKALPAGKFALPAQRAYPIHDAAHVRAAASRLEGQKKAGKISGADYAKARKAIAAAAKRFGIKSAYNMDLGPGDAHEPTAVKPLAKKPSRIHVRADLASGGSLHVRHLRDDDYEIQPVAIGAVEMSGADGAKWIQLAKPGSFRGHRAGPFELNARVFGEIIANFRAFGQEVPVDHEHQTEEPASGLGDQGAPAQGWIKDMRIQGGELWGLVAWNAKAKAQIDAGEYKYFSPAIRFNARDPVSGQNIGALMTSGAMTNNPFLKGMAPLAAKYVTDVSVDLKATRASAQRVMPFDSFAARCRTALKMNELSSMTECSDQLGRLRAMVEAAPHARAVHEGVDLGSYTDSLCALSGMPANASLEDVFEAVQEMIEAAIAQHEATYHEGQEVENDDEGDGAEMRDEPNEETAGMADHEEAHAMTVQDSPETTIKLRDAEKSVNDITAKLKDAETRVTTLDLQAKDATAQIAAKDAELVALRAEADKRALKDRESEVDGAVLMYGQKGSPAYKGIAESDKPALVALLSASPESFRKLYPPVAEAERYRLSMIAAKANADKPETRVVAASGRVPPQAGAADVPSIESLVAKHQAAGLTLSDACVKADAELRVAMRAAG